MLLLFFFNDTATTEIYTLSLHDALPISFDVTLRAIGTISGHTSASLQYSSRWGRSRLLPYSLGRCGRLRSEEHTSELQSHLNLGFRLLLEKKKDRRW